LVHLVATEKEITNIEKTLAVSPDGN
jgi:hypothetical protein